MLLYLLKKQKTGRRGKIFFLGIEHIGQLKKNKSGFEAF